MTSEEAIKYLKKMKDECNDKFHKVRYVTREEALDMAIKALEQEPKETWSIKDVATTFERHGLMTEQEPCEDCISRKEALRIAELGAKEGLLWQQMQLSILPSVQPISKSVIEDIKADIAEFMAKIPALGNCKEGWHNAGQRIGLEQACEIIDNHIAESEE